jgi:hypothetical protein
MVDLVGDIFFILAFSSCILVWHTIKGRSEVDGREEEAAAIEDSTEPATDKHFEEAVTKNFTVRLSAEPEATQTTLDSSEVSSRKATVDAWRNSIRPSNVRRGKSLDSSRYLPAGHADCFNLSFNLITSGVDPLMMAEGLPLNSCISKGGVCPLLESLSRARSHQLQGEEEEEDDDDEDTNGWTVV